MAYDHLRPPQQGMVILAYHRVGRRSGVSVDLPEWLFDEQMSRLAQGPGVVTLDQSLQRLSQADACYWPTTGPHPVVVTFDDGTADFVDVALPVLVRHQVPATLYVATDFIESGHPFPHGGAPASWSGLADALTTGLVTVGSHTHSHALLDRTGVDAAAEDLSRSVELIGDRLGVPAEHFAYPKALLASPLVEREVRKRFRSAVLARTRPNPFGSDVYRLARSPIQVDDGLRFFEEKVRGGMRWEDAMRQLVNRRRFSGQSS